jgi:hypothetical protein
MLSYILKTFSNLFYDNNINKYNVNENDYLIYSYTDNNGIALKTTNNIFLDLFVNIGRDYSYEELSKNMNECMKIDPYKTIAIIFNSRDRKNGKKEKKISNDAMRWIKNNGWSKTYEGNIKIYIDKYGCWKDILTKKYVDLYDFEIKLIAEQLIKDKKNLELNEPISLCAKWAPSENKKYDKRNNISEKIALYIFNYLDNNKQLSDEMNNKYKFQHKYKEFYRKIYLTPLRKKINIIETLMCDNEWNKIEYEKVPAVASKKFKNAFMKHDEERYKEYLNNVMSGNSKINVTGILPHELVNYYLTNEHAEIDNTIESQWKTILQDMKSSQLFDNLISIVDVSGSMFGAKNGSIPAQVAIALGLLISNCTIGSFKNKVITFHEIPEFHEIKGETLKEQVECIRKANWGYNTNFESVADLIINYGKENILSDSNMPKKLIVLSDMQFDEAIRDNDYYEPIEKHDKKNNKLELLYDTFCQKFINNNYKVPKLIYWNLNSDNTQSFPVDSKVENTAIISGFSEQLLKIFMEYDDFNPQIVLDKILEKYIKDVYVDKDELILLSDYKLN